MREAKDIMKVADILEDVVERRVEEELSKRPQYANKHLGETLKSYLETRIKETQAEIDLPDADQYPVCKILDEGQRGAYQDVLNFLNTEMEEMELKDE